MSNDVNPFRKNSLIMLALSAATLLPLKSFAQELPDLMPAESVEVAEPDPMTSEDEMIVDDVLKDIENATPDANVSADTEVLQVIPAGEGQLMPTPAATELSDPQAANTKAAMDQAANLPNIPTLDSQDADDGLFFDADQIVPRSEIGRKGAPRKISPADEPGTKLIVVKTNASASSKDAELVAAQRAMKLGRYAAALDMYDLMYAKNKRDPNVLMGRAEAYQRLGQDDFAVQAYEELLDIRPKNVEARVNMLGLIGQKFPAVALRQLMDMREQNANNVGIVAQIAVAQAAMGELNEAVRYLSIAASMEPQNPTHLFNMAVIADRAGDKKQAISFYEQALEVDTLYGKGEAIPRDSIFERLASLR